MIINQCKYRNSVRWKIHDIIKGRCNKNKTITTLHNILAFPNYMLTPNLSNCSIPPVRNIFYSMKTGEHKRNKLAADTILEQLNIRSILISL